MDVRVDGSLLVHADSVMGSLESPWEAAAAAIRNPNDIHISHPDGSQTLYPAAEPAAASQQAQASNGHSSGAPLFSDGVLHLQVGSPINLPLPKASSAHSNHDCAPASRKGAGRLTQQPRACVLRRRAAPAGLVTYHTHPGTPLTKLSSPSASRLQATLWSNAGSGSYMQ